MEDARDFPNRPIGLGDKVVIPVSMEHAKFMTQVAQFYIDQKHQETFDALKKDHSQ